MTYRFKRDTTCWGGELVLANSRCKIKGAELLGFALGGGVKVVILDGKAPGMIVTVYQSQIRVISPLEQLAEVSE